MRRRSSLEHGFHEEYRLSRHVIPAKPGRASLETTTSCLLQNNRRPRESGGPGASDITVASWIPAFAGMTMKLCHQEERTARVSNHALPLCRRLTSVAIASWAN